MKEKSSQRSSPKDVEIKNRVRGTPDAESGRLLRTNREQERIRKWLKDIRFKKAVIGGVKESDVWEKIEELNAMYEAALEAERVRYDVLLKERVETALKEAESSWQKSHQAEGQSEQVVLPEGMAPESPSNGAAGSLEPVKAGDVHTIEE